MNPADAALLARTRDIMRRLRRPTFARDDILEQPVGRPFRFTAPALCGECTVFVFGSFRCEKYLAGLCTPCHYSGLPHAVDLPREAVLSGLESQFDFLLEHFDDLVLAHQHGHGRGYRLPVRFPGEPFADIQIAGEGSWLADREIPAAIRAECLRRLGAYARRRRLNLHVGLEVKAEDVLRAEASGELESYAVLTEAMDLSLVMGFESASDFVRNVIYAKDLRLEDVEQAIASGHRRDLRPTCFVYAGCHAMGEDEVVADVAASIAWLRTRGAGIYLMLPNLQPHTLPHLLYHAGEHRLIDVRTAARLVDLLLTGGDGGTPVHFKAGHDWSIGGVTSEPEPELTLFGDARAPSCARCRHRFQAAVWDLAQRHDPLAYQAAVAALHSCPDGCGERYATQPGPVGSLEARVAANLDRAEALLPGYCPKRRTVVRTGPTSD